jgi:Prokaryotic RING finger family 1
VRASTALRCPYCHCGIDRADKIIRCSKCRTIHHTSCWFENQHCTVFACTGDAYIRSPLPVLIQIASPILLLFLALFPDGWSFFAPLLIPALLCSMVVLVRFIYDLISGKFMHLRNRLEYMLLFLINFICIYCVVRVFA